jgi:transposase
MMGTQPSHRQPTLFSYHLDLESRVSPDHLLRRIAAALDLSFVLPAVRHCYGRSGHVSLDPRVIVKMLLLLFLYDVPSERELLEQIGVRLDFLWFLGFDLETEIPDHSVLSKARARWGQEVFEQLFTQTVQQCVQAGLVEGRLLHIDSTMVKAQAHKDSVVSSSPELVQALRQAYQHQAAKLQVLAAAPAPEAAPEASPAPVAPVPEPPAATLRELSAPAPSLQVLAAAPKPSGALPSKAPASARAKRPLNTTHISTTDPTSELARSKNGLTELNHKEHRLVDDAHGVITALANTPANQADGTQLAPLYAQHVATTGLKPGQVTVAGDHHYGTADNYLYCAQTGLRAHLGEASAHLPERGKLPLSHFAYEPAQDRLRCPQGHYLVRQQERPQAQAKVYVIEEATHCAQCALRAQCTRAKHGRSILRHVQAEVLEAARAEANSAAGRYSRKRRQHVMEGSFADAANNHGAKKARWRGLWRQQIQSWLIAVVQNLRILVRHRVSGPLPVAKVARPAGMLSLSGLNGPCGRWPDASWAFWAQGQLLGVLRRVIPTRAATTTSLLWF